jgi:hypothetical protein
MSARTRRTTITRLVAVVVAGTSVGIAGAYAVAADDVSPAHVEQQVERDQAAEWARANGVSGLSPASVTPVVSPEESNADLASQLRQIAAWASAEGLAGLSPASLTPVAP